MRENIDDVDEHKFAQINIQHLTAIWEKSLAAKEISKRKSILETNPANLDIETLSREQQKQLKAIDDSLGNYIPYCTGRSHFEDGSQEIYNYAESELFNMAYVYVSDFLKRQRYFDKVMDDKGWSKFYKVESVKEMFLEYVFGFYVASLLNNWENHEKIVVENVNGGVRTLTNVSEDDFSELPVLQKLESLKIPRSPEEQGIYKPKLQVSEIAYFSFLLKDKKLISGEVSTKALAVAFNILTGNSYKQISKVIYDPKQEKLTIDQLKNVKKLVHVILDQIEQDLKR